VSAVTAFTFLGVGERIEAQERVGVGCEEFSKFDWPKEFINSSHFRCPKAKYWPISARCAPRVSAPILAVTERKPLLLVQVHKSFIDFLTSGLLVT
jgi:hypothetical protein